MYESEVKLEPTQLVGYHGTTTDFSILRAGEWVTNSISEAAVFAKMKCSQLNLPPTSIRVVVVRLPTCLTWNWYAISDTVSHARSEIDLAVRETLSLRDILRRDADPRFRGFLLSSKVTDVTPLLVKRTD